MDTNAGMPDNNRMGERVVEKPSERARWMAAMSYIAFVSLIALRQSGKDAFIRYHASQSFLLFIAECAALVITIVLYLTVGKIKIIGFVVIGIFELVVGIAALTLSAVGFVKALFGEYWSIPFLGDYRDRVPGLHWQEG
jgi:uncharacterized membrane protein